MGRVGGQQVKTPQTPRWIGEEALTSVQPSTALQEGWPGRHRRRKEEEEGMGERRAIGPDTDAENKCQGDVGGPKPCVQSCPSCSAAGLLRGCVPLSKDMSTF